MPGPRIPTEDIGELTGRSQNAALCCAIIEDAESAREFSFGRHSPLDAFGQTPFGSPGMGGGSPPLMRELTSLIA
ncbi:MAG TPA: hypothetical protein VFS13_20100 [Steroidobacteraceae bacterium]|jgi:hypothetical protein|nr:hypothetical protein [Steroidobacteraceae bacterium]